MSKLGLLIYSEDLKQSRNLTTLEIQLSFYTVNKQEGCNGQAATL